MPNIIAIEDLGLKDKQKLLDGKTVAAAEVWLSEMRITFTDGSILEVKSDSDHDAYIDVRLTYQAQA